MHFDVGVIGAGPAGLSAAFGLKANGVNVAVFEKYLWGGTCPNYGCDPKKFLVSATDALRHTQLLQGKGITGNLKVDWPTLMKRKEGYTSLTPEKTLNGLKSSGIPSFSGLATFIDENTIELPDGQQIHADKWILAMGQMPRKVQFSGSNFALSSEDFLKMPEMPEDITFIGAGYIAVEFASLANLAGSQVRLIIRGDKALRGFDEELTTELMEEFKQRGIELLYESSVESLSQQNGKILVKLTNEKEFLTDKVFAATGRVANIQGMNLEKAGVQYDENGILVDDKLMTSNPTIFAIGDVAKAGVPKLTPVGAYQGRYIARFISENLDEPITYPVIPTTVFASPRISQVGMSFEEGKTLGHQTKNMNLSNWYNYIRRQDNARIKVVVNKDTQILGAAIRSEEGDEVLNYLVRAINEKRTLQDTTNNIYNYPTFGSDMFYFH